MAKIINKVLALTVGSVWAISAMAEDYPSKPLKIIVPYSAGGSTDVAARIFAEGMSKHLSKPVIVDNRPGAGGTIGTMAVVNAPADGYTILITSASHIVNKILQPDLQYDIQSDFLPLAQITQLPTALVVRSDHPSKSVDDFIKSAQEPSINITYGTAGTGTIQHISAAQFTDRANINATHVPYKGGAAAVTDVIGGRVDFTFAPLVEVLGYVQSNRLRALAVSTKERASAVPNIPTLSEFLPGYESFHWNGFVVKKGTPQDHVDKLVEAVVAASKDPAVIEKLKTQGTQVVTSGPQPLSDLMAREKARLEPLLQSETAKEK